MSKFKVVPTPDRGTRLVPVDPTPPGSHTPGPWRDSFHDYAFIETIDGIAIAKTDCSINRGRGQWVECLATSRANARLIAAAPELLEVLQDLMKMRSECFIPNNGDWWDKKASAVLAKATGGAL